MAGHEGDLGHDVKAESEALKNALRIVNSTPTPDDLRLIETDIEGLVKGADLQKAMVDTHDFKAAYDLRDLVHSDVGRLNVVIPPNEHERYVWYCVRGYPSSGLKMEPLKYVGFRCAVRVPKK